MKKINQKKDKMFNENLYLNTLDIQQKNENSLFYNTNSCLNNICLKELNSNSEYENTLSNTIHQMQSTYSEKNKGSWCYGSYQLPTVMNHYDGFERIFIYCKDIYFF
jgi:hypothetical protein